MINFEINLIFEYQIQLILHLSVIQIQNRVRVKEKTQPKRLLKDSESNFNFSRVKALMKKNIHVCFRDYL